jgi:Vacuolar protein sorting-associated protein 62
VLRRPARLAACLALAAFVSLLVAPTAGAAVSAEQERLVSLYSPILQLREQTDENDENCNTTEEQYNPPTTVDTVLGNPAVRLIHYVNGKDVPIQRAPTAADIAGLDEDYYLDLPGDPLSVKCPRKGSYATDFQDLRAAGRAPALTYAHIATEPGYSGLVVQYWFFYYFNQFNDVHEGDWEGMQISFDADTPAEALAQDPSQIALFQHAGGERADWDDTKVQKDGTHPIVYPAAGSHATFYDNAIYIQNGSHGSGVGCDNTQDPHVEARPRPVIIPTAAGPGSEFQWLSYLGHWGQREKGFNNGPQGPTTKKQWLAPFTWQDGIRQDSPRLPGGAVLGPVASTAFCGAIAGVSEFINLKAKNTLAAIGLALGLLAAIVIPILLTRWRPADIADLRRKRAVGQLLRCSRKIYGRHWRTMLGLAFAGFVILAGIQGVQYLLEQWTGGNDFTLRIHPAGLTLEFSGAFEDISQPIGFAIVAGAVVAYLRMVESGREGGARESYRALYPRLWRVIVGQLLAIVLSGLMIFTVIGIPFGIYFYFAWQLVQQEIIFREDPSIRGAFRGSSALVRGHWWRTVAVIGILSLLAVVAGPLLGFVLIFLNWSPVLVNLVGSIVFALLIPYVAIGRTLLYFDLAAREAEGEPRARRRWWPRARPETA